MKKFVLIISLFLIWAVTNVYAENMLSVNSISLTDQNGAEIKDITEEITALNVTTDISNGSDTAQNPYLLLAVYDGSSEIEKLKFITTASSEISPASAGKITASLPVSGMTEKDRVRVMVWDNRFHLYPIADYKDYPETYSTNNIEDFDTVTNIAAGDRWSYYSLTANFGYDNTLSIRNCVKLTSTENDNWYLASDRTDTWLMTPLGGVTSEKGRNMITAYTIGEKTDGRELQISGTLTGQSNTDLYILKTNDNDTSNIVLSTDYMENVIAHFENVPSQTDSSFSLTIPSEEVESGNDILFLVYFKSTGKYSVNLNATITRVPKADSFAKSPKHTFTNSIDNYSLGGNVTAAGLWSYYSNASVDSSTGELLTMGQLLTQGDGGMFTEEEYAVDINHTQKLWYINKNGQIYTNTRRKAFVYTLDKDTADAPVIQIRGRLDVCPDSGCTATARLRVLAVPDGDGGLIDLSQKKTLYDDTLSYHSFCINIDTEDINDGDDIIFLMEKSSDNEYAKPMTANYSVCGFYDLSNGLVSGEIIDVSEIVEDYSNIPFSTNNITDYRYTENTLSADKWSYLRAYGAIDTETETKLNMILLNQPADSSNGYWYTDAANKTNNWYLTPTGLIRTEGKRILDYNYTIGKRSANKKLKLSGTMTGDAGADLYIIKTSDTDEGTIALSSTIDWNPSIIEVFTDLAATETGYFETYIETEDSAAGNDISFVLYRPSGAGYFNNTLNVTIEEVTE